MESVFTKLYAVNVNDNTEKKNGLTYLSWAWAWAEVKKVVPDAEYTIYERDTEFGPVNYFTDGKTCWVKTGVTLNGLEHIEQLPVMDFKNKSIPLNAVTSTDVNKTIQRSLTKACARHGLGLYIYAGEDLPQDEKDALLEARKGSSKAGNNKAKEQPTQTAKPAEKPASGESGMVPATDEQIAYIRQHASDEDYVDIMTEFGAELENLCEADARRVINEIDAHNTDHTKCTRCGKVITGWALSDGSLMSAPEIIGKSKITYGDVYCWPCCVALKKEAKKRERETRKREAG